MAVFAIHPIPAEAGDGDEGQAVTEDLAPAAADPSAEPHLSLRETAALSFWKLGLLGDLQVQARTPLKRSSSALFQSTYAGAGGRLRVSPVFVQVGPMVAIEPIGVFELQATAFYGFGWPSSSGLLPYADPAESRLYPVRGDRHNGRGGFEEALHLARVGHYLGAEAAATLKAKVGPVIVMNTFTVAYFRFLALADWPEGQDFVYEPLWDRIVHRQEDLLLVNASTVGVEILPGGDRPRLIVGANADYRWTLVSEDRSLRAGVVGIYKPRPAPAWPTFILFVSPYFIDNDRSVFDGAMRAPYVAVAAIWAQKMALRNLRGG
jgi:hypothetical protein